RWFERCSPTSAASLGSVQWSRCPHPARKTAATSAASAKRKPPRECDTSIVSKDYYSARAYPDISRCAATGASGWKNSKPATAARSLSILQRSSTGSSIGLNFFSNRSRPWRPRGTRYWLWDKRPSRRRQRCYLTYEASDQNSPPYSGRRGYSDTLKIDGRSQRMQVWPRHPGRAARSIGNRACPKPATRDCEQH